MKLKSAFSQDRGCARSSPGDVPLPQLDSLARSKILLERPLFFIPGEGDDNAEFWTSASGRTPSMKEWITLVARNPQQAYWVNFVNERRVCRNVSDLAERLKAKVRAVTGGRTAFDVVAARGATATILSAFFKSASAEKIHQCVLLDPSEEEFNKFMEESAVVKNLLLVKSEAAGAARPFGTEKCAPGLCREIVVKGYTGSERWAADSPQLILVILKISGGMELS